MEIGTEVICKQILFDTETRKEHEGFVGRVFRRLSGGWLRVGYMEYLGREEGYIPVCREFHTSELEPLNLTKSKLGLAIENANRKFMRIGKPNNMGNLAVGWRAWLNEDLLEHRKEEGRGEVMYEIRFYNFSAVVLRHDDGLAAYTEAELREESVMEAWIRQIGRAHV